MCISTPKAPAVPDVPGRQAAKLPDGVDTTTRTADTQKRRRALMSTVLTSSQGVLGAPTTTASTTLGG